MGQTTFSGPVISQNGFADNSFTTAERDAIVDPQPGLLIYNTTDNTYQVCTVGGGTPTWDAAFGGGGGGGPNITGVSPSSGVAGSSVTITGTGFTGTTSVVFGTTNSPSAYPLSDTEIYATVPSGSGTVDIIVTTPVGSSTEVGAFTFIVPTVTTYTEGVDYQPGGVVRSGAGSGTNIVINAFLWNNSNYINVLDKGSGTVFTVVQGGVSNPVTTYTGWSSTGPGQQTITGSGSQYGPGGDQSSISFS